MNTKADLDLVENKVDRDQFDACIGEIDRNIQNVMQKMETTVCFQLLLLSEIYAVVLEIRKIKFREILSIFCKPRK